MVKKRLMLGAAFAALSLIPLTNTASAQEEGGNQLVDRYDLDITADWDNDVDVELDWDVDVSKELSIYGFISIDGSVTADALSHATLDDKQLLSGNSVEFEDYQNAYADSIFGTTAEPNPGVSDTADDSEGEPTEAKYANTIVSSAVASSTSGNVGINLAAGDFNLQENAAVISSADGSFPAETATSSNSFAFGGSAAGSKSFDASGSFAYYSSSASGSLTYSESLTASGSLTLDLSYANSFSVTGSSASASARSARTSGAAEAGSFSLQSLYDNGFNTDRYEVENTDVDNNVTVSGALTTADGNLGLNAAAGAFNIQKNALVIASVTGGHLAEATSGVIQHSEDNASVIEDVSNAVSFSSSLTGASGNIGVNIAAGVGNLQLNTLTIANALGAAAADPGSPPAPPPPAPPPPAPPGPV
jgi:hypothetical protein